MKSHWVIAVAVALLGCTELGVANAATNNLASIRKNFGTNASLSNDELKNVVKLANQCGMSEVAEVKTFRRNSGFFGGSGVLLTGPEKVNGRKIAFQTLTVQREGWTDKSKPTNGFFVSSVGQFWVEGMRPITQHEVTTFDTPKGIIRVSVASAIDIDAADKIIKAFTTGRIRYHNHSVKGNFDGVDFSKPDSLRESITNEHYWISFSNSYNQYEFVLNGNDVNILSVLYINI